MRKSIITLFLSFVVFVSAQNLTLDTCQQRARENYPLIKQFDLIEKSEKYNLNNANRNYLPQVSLSARATYQSDVTTVEIPQQLQAMLGMEKLGGMSKDQYQAVVDVQQVVWDGGYTASQKKISKAEAQVDRQNVEVELYTIKDRVNQLFFGILLLNEQEMQLKMLQEELRSNHERVESYIKNGVANQADLDALKVEQLNINQNLIELKSARKSYLYMLSALTGSVIDEKTTLEKPEIVFSVINNADNNRPELKLLEAQSELLGNRRNMVNVGNMPQLGLFVQAGYGKPGLNMLQDEFTPFYIGGVSLKWNLSNLYTTNDNIRKIETGQRALEVQKETFLFNINMLTEQQRNEVEKLQQLIADDDEIIRLRENIKQSSMVKVENGTLTVTDLIRDINAENTARQTKAVHEIKLLLSVYNYKNIQNTAP